MQNRDLMVRTLRVVIALAIGLAALLADLPAGATPGIIGLSGKPVNGSTVVVRGTRALTSLNAAFSDGVTAIAGANTRVPLPTDEPSEVGAVTPPPSGATGTFDFAFVAPEQNGPIMLWIAGMSAAGGGTSGDGASGVGDATLADAGAGCSASAGRGPEGALAVFRSRRRAR